MHSLLRMIRLPRLAQLLSIAAVATACSRTPAATAPQPAVAAAPNAPEYNLRVVLDSGELQIETTPRASAVTVISPAGSFLEAYPTNAPFTAWADSIERLLPNAAAVGAPGVSGEGSIANVPAPIDPKYPTHFWVERTGSSAAPSYRLAGTNGAWDFALALDSAQLVAVTAALRGQLAAGVQSFDVPHQGRTPAEATPAVTGAWMGQQVDRVAATLGGPIVFRFPSGFHGRGRSVRLAFIVDATGFVRTSSIALIGNPPAALALAARDQLSTMRFRPAMRLGQPVPQMVLQEFSFAW